MSASRFTSKLCAASPRPAARPLPPPCPRSRSPRCSLSAVCVAAVQPTRREDSRGPHVPGAHSRRPLDDTHQHTVLALGVQEAMWQVKCGLNTAEWTSSAGAVLVATVLNGGSPQNIDSPRRHLILSETTVISVDQMQINFGGARFYACAEEPDPDRPSCAMKAFCDIEPM